MMQKIVLLALCIGSAYSDQLKRPSNLPCQLNDLICVTEMTHWIYKSAMLPNVDKYENLDPMFHDKIEAALGHVNYTLEKLNVEGFKTCKVVNARIQPDMSSLQIELMCQRIHMDGNYDIDGMLTTYPIKGKGDYYADCTKYQLIIDTNTVFYRKGNNLHLKGASFSVKADLQGDLDLEMRNLFDGNKELSDNLHGFARKNARLFTSLLQDPFFKSCIKKVVKGLNKIYNEIPITDLLQVNEKSVKIGKI